MILVIMHTAQYSTHESTLLSFFLTF